MSEEESAECELVMPFVSVASNGGPHDDVSYTAGFEMGALSGLLEYGKPRVHDQPIHEENVGQADLLAMRFGYHAEVTGNGVEGWRHLRLTRLDLADGVVQ